MNSPPPVTPPYNEPKRCDGYDQYSYGSVMPWDKPIPETKLAKEKETK